MSVRDSLLGEFSISIEIEKDGITICGFQLFIGSANRGTYKLFGMNWLDLSVICGEPWCAGVISTWSDLLVRN